MGSIAVCFCFVLVLFVEFLCIVTCVYIENGSRKAQFFSQYITK